MERLLGLALHRCARNPPAFRRRPGPLVALTVPPSPSAGLTTPFRNTSRLTSSCPSQVFQVCPKSTRCRLANPVVRSSCKTKRRDQEESLEGPAPVRHNDIHPFRTVRSESGFRTYNEEGDPNPYHRSTCLQRSGPRWGAWMLSQSERSLTRNFRFLSRDEDYFRSRMILQATEDGLDLWKTPEGPIWTVHGDNMLPFLISEQARDTYEPKGHEVTCSPARGFR
jgi:hypothetical protein